VRIAVLLAGVLMNFLLAGVLFSVASGMPQYQAHGGLVITSITPGSPAQDASLEPNDVILAANGKVFEISGELTAYLRGQANKPVELTVRRDGTERAITVTPNAVTEEDLRKGRGAVGFTWRGERIEEVPAPAQNPVDAVRLGFSGATELAVQLPGALVDAIGGILGLNPDAGQASGPIGIAQQTGQVLSGPFVYFLSFVGLLSLNLAVLNVLPFPPLDGGRIAVVLIEAVRRRRLPAEREALIYLTGFMVLIVLVILISIQDVQRLVE
jgi:regulator of sigma E protease